MNAIILLGGPGAGKGTLAEVLEKKTDYIHISTGDILRAAVSAKTPIGLNAKTYMDAGELVPDSVILGLIEAKISEAIPTIRLIFDGFPRTLDQAKGLEQIFKKHNGNLIHVIKLDVPRDTLLTRLTGRRICKTCGAIYHLLNRPPKTDGTCDLDNGPLYQRPDDCKETILNRLDVYEKQTAPLVTHYRQQKLIRDINAGQTIEQTTALVLAELNA